MQLAELQQSHNGCLVVSMWVQSPAWVPVHGRRWPGWYGVWRRGCRAGAWLRVLQELTSGQPANQLLRKCGHQLKPLGVVPA